MVSQSFGPNENFESLRFGSYRCAGKTIQRDEFETLVSLTSSPNDFLDGIRLAKSSLDKLNPELYPKLEREASMLADYLSIADKELSGADTDDKAQAIIDAKARKISESIDDINGFISQYKIALQEQDYQIGDIPERTALDSILSKISYTLSYFVAEDSIPHHTDIADAISCISPLGHCKTEDIQSFRTSVSRHLLRSALTFIIESRDSFLEQLIKKGMARQDFIEALTNKDDFTLTCLMDGDNLKITQNGYDVTISWDNPAHLGTVICNNQDLFDLQRVQKFFQAIDGDVTTKIDKNITSVTIHLPHDEDSFFDSDILDDPSIYHRSGMAAIEVDDSPLRFNLPYDDSDPSKFFQISIDPKCLRSEESKAGLAALLNYLSEIDSNNTVSIITTDSLSKSVSSSAILFSSSRINGPEDGGISTIVINNQLLEDPDIQEKILEIVDSINCTGLMLTDKEPESALIKLSKLQLLVERAKKLSKKDLTMHLQENDDGNLIVKIHDSNDNLLVNAIYDVSEDGPEYACFVGRCQKAKLTNYVVEAFDKICGYDPNNPANGSSITGAMQERQDLIRALNRYDIYPTDYFEKYLRMVYKAHSDFAGARSPHRLFLQIRDFLKNGMATVEKIGEEITLDCLPSFNRGRYEDFFLGNVIPLQIK